MSATVMGMGVAKLTYTKCLPSQNALLSTVLLGLALYNTSHTDIVITQHLVTCRFPPSSCQFLSTFPHHGNIKKTINFCIVHALSFSTVLYSLHIMNIFSRFLRSHSSLWVPRALSSWFHIELKIKFEFSPWPHSPCSFLWPCLLPLYTLLTTL